MAATGRWRATGKWLGAIIALLALLAVVAALALPGWLKRTLEEEGTRVLGRKLTIETVSVNPLALSVQVHDIALFDASAAAKVLRADHVYLRAGMASLWHRAPVIEALEIDGLSLTMKRLADRHFDFDDIVQRIDARPPNPEPVRFTVANIRVVNSGIVFEDAVGGKTHTISEMDLGIPFVSNLPGQADVSVEPHFSALINNSPLVLSGKSNLFSDTLESTLRIDLSRVDVPTYLGLMPALPYAIERAKLDTRLEIAFRKGSAGTPQQFLLRGSVVLAEVKVASRDGKPLLSLARLGLDKIDGDPFGGRMQVGSIEIVDPVMTVERLPDGRFTWAPPPSGKAETVDTGAAKPAFQWAVQQAQLKNGRLEWIDATAKRVQAKKFTAIHIDLKSFDSGKPDAASALTLAAIDPDGATLSAGGQVSPLSSATLADVTLSVRKLSPATYAHYWRNALAAQVKAGVALDAKVIVARREGQIAAEVHDGTVAISDLVINARGDKAPLLSAKSSTFSGILLDSAGRQFDIAEAAVEGAGITLARGTNNIWNFSRLQPSPASGSSTPPAAAPTGAPWQASLGKLALHGGSVAINDRARGMAADLRASGIELSADNLSSKAGTRTALALSATVNQNGKFALRGNIDALAGTGRVGIDAERIDIAAFEPYFAGYLNTQLASGRIGLKGDAALGRNAGGEMTVRYQGSMRLSGVRAIDKLNADDLLRWRALSFANLDINYDPAQPVINLGEVALSDFYARLIVNANARLNLQDVMASNVEVGPERPVSLTTPAVRTPATPAPPAGAPASSAPAFTSEPSRLRPVIRIGKLTLAGGNIDFTDNYIKPHYSVALTDMAGSVSAVASDRPETALVGLRARLQGDAPVSIDGRVNPLAREISLDLTGSAKGVELTTLTPYATKYAGYPIEKGKLSAEVTYKVENGKVSADHHLFVDQLTFGDRIDGPDVTKLPVLLAVSLLKNRNGEIDINLPVSGSLSDPEFSVGGLIVRVIVNLLTKAVTSPFALLGAAVSGDHGELSHVVFEPGATVLTPEATKKLDTIGKALHDRPALKIEIAGRADPDNDAGTIRRNAFAAAIRAQKVKALVGRGQSVNTGKVVVAPEEFNQYLEAAYKEAKFDKPRNAFGLLKSLPHDEMAMRLHEHLEIGEAELKMLADRRAQTVRDELRKGVAAERIYLTRSRVDAGGIKDGESASRAEFSLQ